MPTVLTHCPEPGCDLAGWLDAADAGVRKCPNPAHWPGSKVPGQRPATTRVAAPSGPVRGTEHTDQVWTNADAWYRSSVMTAIRTLAESGRPFTISDVKDLGVPEPDIPNRWGGAFRRAAAEGLIEKVAATASKDESRHGGNVFLWIGSAAARRQEAERAAAEAAAAVEAPPSLFPAPPEDDELTGSEIIANLYRAAELLDEIDPTTLDPDERKAMRQAFIWVSWFRHHMTRDVAA